MKLVPKARPISGTIPGIEDVQRLAEANDFPPVDETKRVIANKIINRVTLR